MTTLLLWWTDHPAVVIVTVAATAVAALVLAITATHPQVPGRDGAAARGHRPLSHVTRLPSRPPYDWEAEGG